MYLNTVAHTVYTRADQAPGQVNGTLQGLTSTGWVRKEARRLYELVDSRETG